MLVQPRADVLRLVTQHDHAFISGEFARAWVGPDNDEFVPLTVVLAAALHDVSWRQLDRVPLWDEEAGRPHDFTTFPRELRKDATAEGIRAVEALHPYAGTLVALHYRRLGIETPEFPPSISPPRWSLEDPDVRHDSELIRLFDNLSLFACLTPPGSDPAAHPRWLLDPKRFELPGGAGSLAVEWQDAATLAVAPYPFRGAALEVRIPCRQIAHGALGSAESMVAAWHAAPLLRLPLRIVDPS